MQQSRYDGIPEQTHTDSEGTQASFVTKVVLSTDPAPPQSLLTVGQGDRPDALASTHLGSYDAFWQLCHTNYVLNPFDLTKTPGSSITVNSPSYAGYSTTVQPQTGSM